MHEASEAWRLLGSLELLDVPMKIQIGNMIVDLVGKRKYEKVRDPMIWSLGRLDNVNRFTVHSIRSSLRASQRHGVMS